MMDEVFEVNDRVVMYDPTQHIFRVIFADQETGMYRLELEDNLFETISITKANENDI